MVYICRLVFLKNITFSTYIKPPKNSPSYFALLSLQAIERLAWWMVLVHIALFISEPDYPGGLGLSHTDKGVVFFVWAMTKNLIPIWSGSFAAKNGTRFTLIGGSAIASVGYWSLMLADGFWGMILSVSFMGLGLGMFQNSLQTLISLSSSFKSGKDANTPNESNSENSKFRILGWAGYQWTINLAVLFGGFLSAKLIAGGIGDVFLVSGLIMLLVTIISFIISPKASNQLSDGLSDLPHRSEDTPSIFSISEALAVLRSNKAFSLNLVSFALFTFAYMQFYETLPNYLADYGDRASLGAAMAPLANFMGDSLGPLGFRIEYLFNLNAAITLIAILPLALLMRRASAVAAYRFGLLLVAGGLSSLFIGTDAMSVLVVFIVYTLGESIVNPRILHIADLSAKHRNEKPVYLGLVYLAWAFGLGFGGLIGGWAYDQFVAPGGLFAATDAVWFWLIPIVSVLAGVLVARKSDPERGASSLNV